VGSIENISRPTLNARIRLTKPFITIRQIWAEVCKGPPLKDVRS